VRLTKEQARILTAVIDHGGKLMFEPQRKSWAWPSPVWLSVDFLKYPDIFVRATTLRAMTRKGLCRFQVGPEVLVTEKGREVYRQYKERRSLAGMDSKAIWRDLREAEAEGR
jgi:hypothetical protein